MVRKITRGLDGSLHEAAFLRRDADSADEISQFANVLLL